MIDCTENVGARCIHIYARAKIAVYRPLKVFIYCSYHDDGISKFLVVYVAKVAIPFCVYSIIARGLDNKKILSFSF